jgi:peptidoglycan/LPS O-acetylase OafA/YrhL
VLSVVSSHMWHTCVSFHVCADNLFISQFIHDFGFTGVMFFFVHTCLVLMLSMHRAPDAHRARNFLIRRAFRIYPLCWAAILLALVTGLTDLPQDSFHALGWRGILANLLLVQNLFKGRGVNSILGPLWSLPWEVQMYLVLPFFFAILRRYNRLSTVFMIWFGFALLALAGTQPQLSHMGWTFCPPMFIAGMVAYSLLMHKPAQARRYALPAWGWPLFVLSLFVIEPLLVGGREMSSPVSTVINSCNCFVLSLAIPSFHELTAGWIVRPAQQIAQYSYSVYLLHVPAIIFCFMFFPGLALALKIPLALAFTGLLSFVSFHVIEDPFIRLGKRLTQSKDPARPAVDAPAFDQCSMVKPDASVCHLPGEDAPGIKVQEVAE